MKKKKMDFVYRTKNGTNIYLSDKGEFWCIYKEGGKRKISEDKAKLILSDSIIYNKYF